MMHEEGEVDPQANRHRREGGVKIQSCSVKVGLQIVRTTEGSRGYAWVDCGL